MPGFDNSIVKNIEQINVKDMDEVNFRPLFFGSISRLFVLIAKIYCE